MPSRNDERDLASQAEAEIIMLDSSVRSLGVLREQWLADYYRLKRPALTTWHEARVEQQQTIAVYVEKSGSLWLCADLLPLLEHVLIGKLTATYSAVLPSSDSVVWDRRRTKQLFDFSYRLGYYTLVPKCQYGYFAPPLLHRGRLVGRMDAKTCHQTGTPEVTSLWLQEGIKPMTMLQRGLRQMITDFAS